MTTLTSHDVGVAAALLAQGRPSEAERHSRALLDRHPSAGILWKILGVAQLRQGKEASEALTRAADLMPADAEAQANLGAALHGRGQWAAALSRLQRALAIDPANVDAMVQAADAMRALDRAREAVPLYLRALTQDPCRIEAHNNLANAWLMLGEHDAAVASYRRALALDPEQGQILANLGNALRQSGALQEALDVTRRAIERDPRSSKAHNNLGLILAARGQRAEAAACYRQALELDPDDIDALNNLGNVLRELGARRDALAAYGRALALDPRIAEAHYNSGNVLFESRQLDAAIECYRRALALRPDHAQAQVGLGGALRLQRRTAEAESACLSALALDPKSAEALALLGELRADQGRFAEAGPLLEQAVGLKPGFAFGLASVAANRKMSAADGPWLQHTEQALRQRPPLTDEINLRFARGKYFDDLQEYARAFGEYRAANELTKQLGGVYERSVLHDRIEGIVRRCDADFVNASRPYACRSELPVLIVGMPRSGTSLLEQIVASHPEVVGAGELQHWDGAFAAYTESAAKGEPDADALPRLAALYVNRLSRLSHGASRVVDKMPANFLYAGLIHAALPRARFIHMQRHPIDTCLSIYFQNFPNMGPFANDLENLAYYYGEYRRLMEHWRTLLPAAALLDVPYEALLQDQEGWTRRILEFLGLPWDPKCLDFHLTERVVVTASKWQVRQKLTNASAGRWQHYRAFIGPLERLLDLEPGR